MSGVGGLAIFIFGLLISFGFFLAYQYIESNYRKRKLALLKKQIEKQQSKSADNQ